MQSQQLVAGQTEPFPDYIRPFLASLVLIPICRFLIIMHFSHLSPNTSLGISSILWISHLSRLVLRISHKNLLWNETSWPISNVSQTRSPRFHLALIQCLSRLSSFSAYIGWSLPHMWLEYEWIVTFFKFTFWMKEYYFDYSKWRIW